MITQSLKMAVGSISSNKVRSTLTMLGVIIGVLAITVLVSLVSSTTDEVKRQIEDLGSNMVVAQVTSTRYTPIKMGELDKLLESPSVKLICPSLRGQGTAKVGVNTFDATVEGTTPQASVVRKWKTQEGRFIMTPDIDNGSPVAVIGVNVANELYDTSEGVTGRSLILNGIKCTVAGVLEEQGTSIAGSDDDKIIVPYTFAQRMFPSSGIRVFYVSAVSSDQVDEAETAVRNFLLQRLGNDEDAFTLINQSSILDMMSTVTGLMTTLLGGIAAISLLVGGIGIMNIMLVSVSERTREIGIRKAIGASRKVILVQFLIEASLLSVIGGLIGIALSAVVLAVLSRVMDMAITLSLGVVAISLGFSVGVGLVFGMYPADKASKLHPIEALRYEN